MALNRLGSIVVMGLAAWMTCEATLTGERSSLPQSVLPGGADCRSSAFGCVSFTESERRAIDFSKTIVPDATTGRQLVGIVAADSGVNGRWEPVMLHGFLVDTCGEWQKICLLDGEMVWIDGAQRDRAKQPVGRMTYLCWNSDGDRLIEEAVTAFGDAMSSRSAAACERPFPMLRFVMLMRVADQYGDVARASRLQNVIRTSAERLRESRTEYLIDSPGSASMRLDALVRAEWAERMAHAQWTRLRLPLADSQPRGGSISKISDAAFRGK